MRFCAKQNKKTLICCPSGEFGWYVYTVASLWLEQQGLPAGSSGPILGCWSHLYKRYSSLLAIWYIVIINWQLMWLITEPLKQIFLSLSCPLVKSSGLNCSSRALLRELGEGVELKTKLMPMWEIFWTRSVTHLLAGQWDLLGRMYEKGKWLLDLMCSWI